MSGLPRAAGVALLAALACGRSGGHLSRSTTADDPELGRLRASFEAATERDAMVREVLALGTGGEVVVAIRPALLEEVVKAVARLYLDRVELDLTLEERIHESGEVTVEAPLLGRVRAGTWQADVVVHGVRGRLRALEPSVELADSERLRLSLPVVLERAEGSASVRFAWDASSVAGAVCRDFEVTRRLRGTVLPDRYTLSGELRLASAPNMLLARPVFPRREFRVRVDLSEESWRTVRAALDEQDRLLRCGIGLDPSELVPRLRSRLRQGFNVALPQTLFRTVELPGSLQQSVVVEERRIDLSVQTHELKLSPEALWYAAAVESRADGAGGGTSVR